MLVFLFSRALTSFAALFYPAYASFKTLSQRPASEEELERWLMYWSVLGTMVGVEYWAEWLISWIPLYYTFKLFFLLYLAMPQTRGATYVYLTYLEPFLKKYESQIDSSAASAKASALTFIQERLRALWRHVSTSISQQQDAQMHPISQLNTSNPPTQSHPATGTAQLLESFWRTYGSNVVATGAALIQQSAAAANAASQRAQAQRANHSPNERRRQLEAELASLPPVTMPQNTQAAYSTSRASSASDINSEMRERALSASKFEEIAVPEGYEDDDTVGPSYGTKTRPNPSKRTSWFGWGSGSGSERLKDD